MDPKLQKQLYDKYPKIFIEKDLPMTATCMCWGIETGSGWFDLLNLLCFRIQNHVDQEDWVPESIFKRLPKRIWNRVIWNYIIYPIAHGLLLGKSSNGVRSDEYFKSCGWKTYQWIQKHCNATERYIKSKEPRSQVVALQVKEKFGGLRFYTKGGDAVTQAYIEFAESLSYNICEACGSTKDVTASQGWITIRCAECRAKDAKQRKKIGNTAGRLKKKK